MHHRSGWLDRRRFSFVCSLLGVLLILGGFHPSSVRAQNQQMVDRIAAVVGDEIVLKSEVDQLVMRQTQQQGASYSKDMWMNSLEQLIDQKLLAEKARRDTTVTVSDQQVSTQLDRRINQMAQRAGGERQLEKAYGMSIVEIKETFREDFRNQILAQKLRQRRMQKIDVTPSEVRQWFEKIPTDSLPNLPETVRLSHVVRYPKPTDKARQKAQNLIRSIRDSIVNGGASFEEMARRFSDDSGTASSGGRLQDVNLDDLVPEFAAVASRTPVGEVSQFFYNENHNGYHIVRVNSKSGNTVDLNHILIKLDQEAFNEQATIDYLNAVRDTLLNQQDVTFELMARRHSEENRSAENGGRVTDPQSGTRDLVLEALGPSWRETIQKLNEGEISRPTEVKLLNGDRAYHIVRLDRHTPAHRANLKTDYDRIRELALQDKRNRKMQEWLDQLREEMFVDVRISEKDLTAMRTRP